MGKLGTDSLLELLDLEEIDTDLYRGLNEGNARNWPALYGGQVAAQALRAAANTVPDGRLPNSLHGYFLRPGRSDRHVILRVARDRDGRSFSARHVVAVQNGEVIFSMSASFHAPRSGPDFEEERPVPPAGPDELEESSLSVRFRSTLEMRPLPPAVPIADGEHEASPRLWVRTRERLPDDPLIRACALTYISDLSSGFGDGTAVGSTRGGPSIDHALWFHNDVAVDEWLYMDLWPIKAGGSRGLYSGTLHSQGGLLAAMLTQEVLFRPPPPPEPPS